MARHILRIRSHFKCVEIWLILKIFATFNVANNIVAEQILAVFDSLVAITR